MRNTFKALALASALLLVGGASVYATLLASVTADIPFAFEAGDQSFPAGQYVFQSNLEEKSNMLTIEDKSGRKHEFMIAETKGEALPTDTSKIVFQKAGDRHYLSQVWIAGMDEIEVVPPKDLSREEVQNARTTAKVEVPAHK